MESPPNSPRRVCVSSSYVPDRDLFIWIEIDGKSEREIQDELDAFAASLPKDRNRHAYCILDLAQGFHDGAAAQVCGRTTDAKELAAWGRSELAARLLMEADRWAPAQSRLSAPMEAKLAGQAIVAAFFRELAQDEDAKNAASLATFINGWQAAGTDGERRRCLVALSDHNLSFDTINAARARLNKQIIVTDLLIHLEWT